MTISTARKEAIDRILSDAVASKSTPALFFGATTSNGPIYIGTAGTKSLNTPTSGAVDEDTVFWLCSEMKLITSIAALQLIEREKIGLDTAVESVLPELANPVVVTAYDEEGKVRTTTPAKGKITFGQLLNHSSGLGYSADSAVPAVGLPPAYTHRYKDGEDVSTFFKIIKGSLPGIPLKCEPGTDFTYGFSTDCLGFIVARAVFSRTHLHATRNYLRVLLPDTSLKRPTPIGLRVASWKDGMDLPRWNKILHMLVKNPILSRAPVNSLLSHTLPPAAATTISEFVGMFHPRLGLPPNAGQFGRRLFVTTADVPGKRKSGSGSWDGYASTSFFIDPSADATHERLYDMLERELYAAL
ncbi:beta-lactamase/transpeptidase-like protein [Mycena vitilis]|nr:beta-lactamase/transpeptidase-like protein [Mycena vitilis]